MRPVSVRPRVLILLIVALALVAAMLRHTPVAAQRALAKANAQAAATTTPLPPVNAMPTAHLVRVYFSSRAALDRVAAAYDVWQVDYAAGESARGSALLQATDDEIARLRLAGFAPVPVDAASAPGDPAAAEGSGLVCGGATIDDFPCYRSVTETYDDLAALAAAFPALATWQDIGDSWEKVTPGGGAGDDLGVLVVTNHASVAPKFKFFLMGAIHARELATAETATRFAEMLVRGYGVDPEITWLLDHGEAHILAQANPDGRRRAESGYCWRKNTHDDGACSIGFSSGPGIDLNRNFAFQWNQCAFSGCSSGYSCSLTYRGVSAASEPETAAIQSYLASIFPDARGAFITDSAPLDTAGLLLTLHSYGQLVLFPWGWTDEAAPNGPQLQMLADKFGYVTEYRACAAGAPGCLYSTDGTTDDWLYGERGIAAFTIEMGTAFFQACTTYEQSMAAPLLETLIYAFKAARRPYQTPFGPEPVNLQVSSHQLRQGEPFTLTATLDTTRHDDHDGRPLGDVVTPTVVTSATWYLEAPSWVTGTVGTAMLAADGVFDEAIEPVFATIDTTALPVGCHLLLVEGVNDAGQAGVPSAIGIEVLPSLPAAPTPQPPGQRSSCWTQQFNYLPVISTDGE